MTTSSTEQFEISRQVAASPDLVWAAWTEPDQMRCWMAPEGCQVERLDADVRPGGAYRIQMMTPGGQMTAVGVYREVVAGQRISYSWRWEGTEMPDSLVEIDLTGTGDGTRIRLRHGPFATVESAENHLAGWNGCLDMLERHLAAT